MTPYDQYTEYANMMAKENGDYYNTKAFQQHLANSPVFETIDKLSAYEEILLKRALKELKNKREWQDLEADDIRTKATGFITQMSASELLDRYKTKIQHTYRAEEWFKDKLDKCDKVIAETNTWQTNSKRKTNKLNHWRKERVIFDCKYWEYVNKSHRYEKLIYKWAGICDQVKQAAIAKEIALELKGEGNKYGFNPNMQSRETATGIFTDKE